MLFSEWCGQVRKCFVAGYIYSDVRVCFIARECVTMACGALTEKFRVGRHGRGAQARNVRIVMLNALML